MFNLSGSAYIAHFDDVPEASTESAAESRTGGATDVFDIPGLVRRVRRTRDLSQRDLAMVLGVDHSLVARWETGHREPRLGMFRELLRLAEIHLEVRDTRTEQVRPMRPDAIRDGGGRRLPAHLDLFAFIHAPPVSLPFNARARDWCVPHRSARDDIRARLERPPAEDHPSRSQLLTTLAAAKAAKVKAEQAVIQAHRSARIAAGDPFEIWLAQPCTCPDACFELAGCAPGCTCRCEDPHYRPPGTDHWTR